MNAVDTLTQRAELSAAMVECLNAGMPESVVSERLDFPIETVRWARDEAISYRLLMFKAAWERRRSRIQRG